MPTIISLQDFLLTGEFAGIRADSRLDDVPKTLGEPTHRYEENNGFTHFLYDSYELAFMDNAPIYVQNHAMHLHQSDRTFENQRIRIDAWIWDRPAPLTKPEIVVALSDINAVFRHVIDNGRNAIEMDCGVVLDFNPSEEDAKRIVCDAISLTFPAFKRELDETA